VNPRPPFPPFTEETARQKVQAAEDAWNTREPGRVALAYTEDSAWRNRDEFINGRAEIVEFLRRKWARELDYALRPDCSRTCRITGAAISCEPAFGPPDWRGAQPRPRAPASLG